MKKGVFLQVRLNSSRLPRKALLPLGNFTVIEWAMRALKIVKAQNHVLLTDHESLSELGPLAANWGWDIFAGDPENVLNRYVSAARKFQTDFILRATGDNPFVSASVGNDNLVQLENEGWDLFARASGPLGTGTEAVRFDALEYALSHSPDSYEKEHVTPFIYRKPEIFRVGKPAVQTQFFYPQGRVTLDTKEDYEKIQTLLNDLKLEGPPEADVLIPWLKLHG